MIASFPMYARASNRDAHDALWALIHDRLLDRGIDAPQQLDHDRDHMSAWGRDDLVLSQICNLPYRAQFFDQVTPIGAADYGLEGCAPGYYRSVFVVHQDSTATTPEAMSKHRFAFNDTLSQSGYGSAQLWADARGFLFDATRETGSHHASIAAVAGGTADIAAIDAQTWWIEQSENPLTAKLKVIGYTDPTPGMTFITRKGQDSRPYFDAITAAIEALDAGHAQVLGLKRIIALPQTAYDLPFPPKQQAILA
jgi:hypothetical protein